MTRVIGIGILFLLCCPVALFGQDTCLTALPVGDGPTAFDTTGLVTDGPIPPCGLGFNTDIFFCYTASCTGTVTVDTCMVGTLGDTIMQVYAGCACPPVGPPAGSVPASGCDDDACPAGPGTFGSIVSFPATAGSTYLIQVGGWSGEAPGTGTLNIANAGAPCPPPALVAFNEIRADMPGTDNAEFVELAGVPSTPLGIYTVVVLGDGTVASGVIERFNTLVGAMPLDGFYVLGDTASVAIGATVDLDIGGTDLFENADNLTFLLVEGFTGLAGQDLDTNDDGVLDIVPWTSEVDSVALVINSGGFNPIAIHDGLVGVNCTTLNAATEQVYSSVVVGPDQYTGGSEFIPGHIKICGMDWEIGNFAAIALDTPGAANNCTTPLNNNCLGFQTAFASFPLTNGENYIPWSSAGATTDGVASFCAAGGSADIWFSYVTPAGTCLGDVTYSLCGSSFDTVLTVYTGTTCALLVEVPGGCNDDFCGLQSQVTLVGVPAATTHRIKVSGFGGATGDVVITVSHSTSPANDNCETPAVAVDGPQPFNTACATNSGLNVPLPSNVIVGRDLWYEYTASCTGVLTVSTNQPTPLPAGTLTDSKLAVYGPAATCPPSCADLLGYDDDAIGLLAEIVDVPVVMGTTYLIRVGGFSATTTGTGILTLTCTEILPPGVCGGAIPVAEGVFAFNNTGEATDGVALDPMVCDMGPFGTEQIFQDLYYCYTSTCGGLVTIDATGFDTRLAVYSDCSCPELPANVIACDDDTGSGGGFPFHAQASFTATAGASYLVRVGGFGPTDVGAGTLTIAAPMVNPNDECLTAVTVVDGVNAGTTACSTPSLDPVSLCAIATNNDAWFSYVASCTGTAVIDLSGSGPPPSLNWDTTLFVYDGCGGPVVACDDDLGAGLTSLVTFQAIAGVDYRIRVGAFGATVRGAVSLTISCVPPLPNDDCIDALPLTGSGMFTYDTGPPPATTDGPDLTGFCEPLNPAAGSGDGFPFGLTNRVHRDVWFCYTPCVPMGQTATVSISTLGAGIDTRIAVYDSCVCPPLPTDLVACDDDTATGGLAPFEAAIPTITMVGGTSYLIQVGGFDEATPTLSGLPLTITCTADCVPPTAGFSAMPTSGNAPLTVTFTDSSAGTGPLSYAWDFDGDAVTDDTSATPAAFVYTTAGNYTASLTVTNACGSDTATLPIEVCAPLTVGFSFTNTGIAEACAAFTDLTTGDIDSWDWDFGNGGMSTAQNPSTTYPIAGTYTVTLTVTGSCGRVVSSSQSLTVLAVGDCNGDGSFNISDPIGLANYLFGGGAVPACLGACEVNGDGSINLGDVVYALNRLFNGGPAPVARPPCTGC